MNKPRVKKQLPSADVLNRLFSYSPETGDLTHNIRTPEFMTGSDASSKRNACASWNGRYAGTAAFSYKDKRGYFHGKVLGKNYQAHRVIWKMFYGFEPDNIDHINGNPSDNRIRNLRNCSVAENCRNYAKTKKGSSAYRGVCWVKRDKKWAASISNGNGGKISLGHYAKERDAAMAYDAAAKESHGDFATLNFPDKK